MTNKNKKEIGFVTGFVIGLILLFVSMLLTKSEMNRQISQYVNESCSNATNFTACINDIEIEAISSMSSLPIIPTILIAAVILFIVVYLALKQEKNKT